MAKILIVDDEERLRDMTARILALDCHEVLTAADGEAAWQILTSFAGHGVQLIITDQTMPRMTGPELVQRVRENETLARLPIIMVSGESIRGDLHIDARLEKPVINWLVFREEVKKLLARQ